MPFIWLRAQLAPHSAIRVSFISYPRAIGFPDLLCIFPKVGHASQFFEMGIAGE